MGEETMKTEESFLKALKTNIQKQKQRTMYNPTCIITGKKDNLQMYPHRDNNGNMVGWVFIHESINIKDVEINWSWKVTDHSKIEVKGNS